MPEEAFPSSSTKEKLIQAGIQAFYEKGYSDASLRQICKDCGVTTGAFYFCFSSKEALFCAIVDPVIRALTALGEELSAKEVLDPSTGQDHDREMMKFELLHRREILILAERSAGSCRENFRELCLANLIRFFTASFTAAIGHKPDPKVIRLLAELRFEGNLSILKGNYTMEQTLLFNGILSAYADGGFKQLIQQYKDVL